MMLYLEFDLLIQFKLSRPKGEKAISTTMFLGSGRSFVGLQAKSYSENTYFKKRHHDLFLWLLRQKGKQSFRRLHRRLTDTISEYGIVADPDFVLIDKTGKHIYKIFPFDNGPDYTSEGIYRIIENGKIGYADSLTSTVLIEPKFACALPFENGKAKVSFKCKMVVSSPGDEHRTWQSDEWFYVNRMGKVVE